MRFIIFSDTHGKHEDIVIPKGDVLIFCGDMCGTGEFSQVTKFSFFLSKLPHKHKILIAGNHDFPLETDIHHTLIPKGVSYLCDKAMYIRLPNQASLDRANDLLVYGMPWTPQFFDWAFMLPRDGDRLKSRIDAIPSRVDILITHGPPKGILDNAPRHSKHAEFLGYEKAGCSLLRERVDSIRPKLHVFGHIHYDYGILRKNDTLFVNACVCNEHYEPVNKPIVLDYINGRFEEIND